ncbi:MAG: hypothetical protein HY390_07320 [Deltaproteobacteria bacterium]|nr:hypothetical protein [Deltaproteobacteria bacterium]
MLTVEKIKELFEALNEKLKLRGDIGEIGIIGGAVMCLVYQSRKATRDVNAIFKPTHVIRQCAAELAASYHLPTDWLNDAAKGYLQNTFKRQDVMNLSHLRIWAPEAEYMLAMKCLSARWDTHDREDVIFLIQFLKIDSAERVFKLIESYYPKKQIPPKTQFFIEEVFDPKEKKP